MLVASGFDDGGGGGLFVIRDTGVDTLDRLATTGFAINAAGTLAGRLFWTDDDPQSAGAVAIYDATGLRVLRRLDELKDPHGARWFGDSLVAVSTQTNQVLWLDESGAIDHAWTAPGDGGDCWHLNCLTEHDGHVLVTAFGRFGHHRDWARGGARDGAGIIAEAETGRVVVNGLTAPHDPFPIEGGWLVNNSGKRELLQLDLEGNVVNRADLGGWTRGLVVDDDRVYVGVTPHRLLDQDGLAWVAVLDRPSLREIERRPLPCTQVFSLAWVAPPLIEGLRHGLGNGPLSRTLPPETTFDAALHPDSRYGASVGHSLEVRLTSVPQRCRAGDWATLEFVATNRGEGVFHSAAEGGIDIGALWIDAEGATTPIEARARLPRPVLPGSSAPGTIRIAAPPEPGTYVLRAAALREGAPWFDTIDPELGEKVQVVVGAS